MGFIQNIGENIWIVDGPAVPWFRLPYTTRMTIVRLASGQLWIHSPGKIIDGLLDEVNALGEVKYLVSPNKIHHLFMKDWIDVYPEALSFSSPGLRKKRVDIEFNDDLTDNPEGAWSEEIDQLIFKGSPAMEEVVFFHKSSATLILTDLIENFPQDHFKGIQKIAALMTGIVAPNGKTPVDWRMTFMFRKKQARECMSRILAWKPRQIVIAHGECVYDYAEAFLRKSFSWLGKFD